MADLQAEPGEFVKFNIFDRLRLALTIGMFASPGALAHRLVCRSPVNVTPGNSVVSEIGQIELRFQSTRRDAPLHDALFWGVESGPHYRLAPYAECFYDSPILQPSDSEYLAGQASYRALCGLNSRVAPIHNRSILDLPLNASTVRVGHEVSIKVRSVPEDAPQVPVTFQYRCIVRR